jgi:hypothetical protein
MLETVLFTLQGILGALTLLAGAIVGMYLFNENLRARFQLSENLEKKAAIGILALMLLACLVDQSTLPILGFEAFLTVGGFFGLFMMVMDRPITQLRD